MSILEDHIDLGDGFRESTAKEGATKRAPFKKFVPPDSDDESYIGNERSLFNVNEAWDMLMELPTCQKVIIDEPTQRRFGIRVGINVTQEFPWKYIQYKYLRDYLFDNLENGVELIKLFQGYNPENHILVGYAPTLTQDAEEQPDGDPYIFFISTEEAKTALNIIQSIELFERWRMKKRLIKHPRRWISFGSEGSVNLMVKQRTKEPIDVEIQSTYPIKVPQHLPFTFRKADDVRDGYIELIPNELARFDNIQRRRITIGIQSAPKMVDREQQTIPTFPSNAWTQYLYELDEELELDASEDEEEEKRLSRQATPISRRNEEPPRGSKVAAEEEEIKTKPPPELSDQIKLLLNTLEFNQIDMYRNDYLLICEKQIDHYTNPYLEEFICFANISKSHQRFVCGLDWYPTLSGLVAASYTFSTPSTITTSSHKVDMVQRAVLEPNPILLWSFSDNLDYKLEFEAPFETTCLSFCPYDSNLLFGGSKNGQVVIWDLQQRAERLEVEELLTATQAKYRGLIAEFIQWTIEITEDSIVPPALVTPLEMSPTDAITGFYWLSHHFYVNNFGKTYIDPDRRNKHKIFLTCATDGTVSFWDLDAVSNKKGQAVSRARHLPKELTQSESFFKNKTLNPVYVVAFNEPITSIIADTSVFSCMIPSIRAARANPNNYRTHLVSKSPKTMRQSLILSSLYGRIHFINWLGLYTDTDVKENVNTSVLFAQVHDGPIISMKKNPFYRDIFASIGRHVFAVWKEDYNYSPIFWRKRPCDLTAVAWSESRPSVLFLTRIDGNLEAWDILARDDDAVLNEILGGGVVTTITEHKPSVPHKVLGIGDYNSSIRLVKLPTSFDTPQYMELEKLTMYVKKEEKRKTSIQAWEQKYYEINKDVIEAKREAEAEARKELDRLEKEEQFNIQRKTITDLDEKNKSVKPLSQIPYPERMAVMWDELNLNRMMTILMSRKQMDPDKLKRETAMEKERLAYEASKKESLVQILANINEEVAAIRARILPAEIPDMQRSEMIQATVREVLALDESYENVSEDATEVILKFAQFDRIDYIEFLQRGRHRRQILDQSLGGNTERWLWYDQMLQADLLGESTWGYEYMLQAPSESSESNTAKSQPTMLQSAANLSNVADE